MNDEIPESAKNWPPKAIVIDQLSVGEKTLVSLLDDESGRWLEIGGLIGISDSARKSAEELDIEPRAGGTDRSQARIYCSFDTKSHLPDNLASYMEGFIKDPPTDLLKDQRPEIRIILPQDLPFRASRKGVRPDRSKSFKKDGMPVPEVLILYALKTGRLDDRELAMRDTPIDEIYSVTSFDDVPLTEEESHDWGQDFDTQVDGLTWGQLFDRQASIAGSRRSYSDWISNKLVLAATRGGRLRDWALWDRVAQDAADYACKLADMTAKRREPDNNFKLLQAIKAASSKCAGVPPQKTVEELWRELGGIGEWRDIRDRMGFAWLPPIREWEDDWKDKWGLASS